MLTRMPCEGDRGRDLGEKRNALSLGTAIRYASAAGMATQRAHRAFLAHRKAKQAGLILPAELRRGPRRPERHERFPRRGGPATPPTTVPRRDAAKARH